MINKEKTLGLKQIIGGLLTVHRDLPIRSIAIQAGADALIARLSFEILVNNQAQYAGMALALGFMTTRLVSMVSVYKTQ